MWWAVLLVLVGAEPEPASELEVDAVTGSQAAVPRAPDDDGDDDVLVVGCLELRMIPDYDGHEILALTFTDDGRCGDEPEEVTPPATP